MDKTKVLATAIDMARSGLGLTPAAAFDCIAELVAQQDPADELYDWKVERLLRLAACLWTLKRELIEPAP